jgi:hypothetical protein
MRSDKYSATMMTWTGKQAIRPNMSQLFNDQPIFIAVAAGPRRPPAQELTVERRPFASIFVKKLL